ncbi:polysaccharide lyase family 7 protein [Vibrio astriarenae]
MIDGSSDETLISGNQFNPSNTVPDEPEDGEIVAIVAPYTLDSFKAIIKASKLQRWDPTLEEGDKLDISNQTIANEDYFDDYFYAYQASNQLVFKMSGYKNRSELRVEENFDTSEIGITRTLNASFKPVGIQEAIANSVNGDEVTFLQIHNKGEDETGNGYIPHPLLRVVYEESRNGLTGHYWAVIKANAVDCSSDSPYADSEACDSSNAYTRFDLGEADLNSFTNVELAVSESQLTISVNELEKVNLDISYWAHLLSYFKAGIYNQYDDGDGINDWSEVRFAALTVSETETTPATGWDIDQWKITIPASKDDWYGSGGSSAAELVPAHCNDSSKQVLNDNSDIVYNEYDSGDISFFNVSQERMYFRADMGYGTSTSNSSYIRSELRELFNAENLGTCSTSNQDQMTSWFIDDSATGTKEHKLTSILRIEDYPIISGQDPKVVVGQVHGWEISQALIKVLWEGENKPVRVIMNQDFFTDNEKCDSSNPVNNCDNWSFSIELGTYAANVDWQYEIIVDEEGIYLATLDSLAGESSREDITIHWGEAFTDKNGDSVTMTENWKDEAYYFKAGIYPQFKPDSDYVGERFDVSFSTINIDHQ